MSTRPMDTQFPKVMRTAQACRYLGVSEGTFRRFRKLGLIEGRHLDPDSSTVWFLRDDLDQLAARDDCPPHGIARPQVAS